MNTAAAPASPGTPAGAPSAAASPSGPPARLYRELVAEVLGAFFTVHGELGFGFADSVYIRALAVELFVRRLTVSREVPVSAHYKGVTVGTFRAHLVVDDKIVVHVTAGDRPNDTDRFNLLNYLRASGKEIGLWLHFGPSAVARRVVATRAAVAIEDALDDVEARVQ